ncbi:MAG TPA: lysophospholipid acyltransferase family protein [Gemmatimonadales bacterium]|nr:lysophospholipid acyltransferase family protein [Gemmatimonadales bacterium]
MSEAIAGRMFERYVRRQAARAFAGVHWRVAGPAERRQPDVPTLFVANHSNWWDGGLAFLVSRALGVRFRILMDASQLARYRFFARIGARPIRRDAPRAAWADLHAAASELRADTGLWIFPQGERRPPGERPLRCERGAAELVRAAPGTLRVWPVAFRYAFVGEQRPEAFALVGEEWTPGPADRAASRRALIERIAARLEDTVFALDELVAHERLDAFRPLTPGRLSVNKRLDRFRHSVGLLRGPFEARNG